MVCTWLGESCRQVEAEEMSNSRNTIHQTTYKDFFWALYTLTRADLMTFSITARESLCLHLRILVIKCEGSRKGKVEKPH